MKFINYLESITGIGIYPLISLMIFFIFFVLMFLFVMKADKKYIHHLKQLPLNNQEN
jgi:cytochrome c oxidase cbb3-type subunit 3